MTREEIISFNKANKIDGYPGTMKKICSVFDSLPIQSITDYRNFWFAVLKEKYGNDKLANRFLYRSLTLMDKYISQRNLANNDTLSLLIAELDSKLAEFKDMYLEKVRMFAQEQYRLALERRSWNLLDWLATSFYNKLRIGYVACVLVPYQAANGKTIWMGLCDPNGYQVMKLTDIQENVTYTYYSRGICNTHITVTKNNLAAARISKKEIYEVPAKAKISKALILYNDIKIRAGFSKDGEDKWINRAQDQAKAKFAEDIKVLANKIRNKGVDETKLKLLYAENDPKHIKIKITDGTTILYARSILAAEYSLYVSPHFRFIVTER